jgi:hypothetical protein
MTIITHKRLLLTLTLITLLLSVLVIPTAKASSASSVECRYGMTVSGWSFITSPNKSVKYFDMPLLGSGLYLDYGSKRDPSVPSSIQFVNVIYLKDGSYSTLTPARVQTAVTKNPGSIWIIGNEPDDATGDQDDLTPQVYAQRFFTLATVIRASDPTAKIGFGTIIMPTALRILYLQFAWDTLKTLAASAGIQATSLIDFWSTHGFLINEQLNGWGSGIPHGMEAYASMAETLYVQDMANVSKFKERMLRFRQFMKDNGEQNKPLWLTEFGVLAPSVNFPPPAPQHYLIPESTTGQFFKDTVDWMESTTDPNLGMQGDGNRLFQKWFWYSLNDPQYHMGGAIVDPYTMNPTEIGKVYLQYEPPANTEPFLTPDLTPVGIRVRALSRVGTDRNLVNYALDLRIRNLVTDNHLAPAIVKLYDETNHLLGTVSGKVNRCGGDAYMTVSVTFPPAVRTLKVVVNPPSGGSDANTVNDTQTFQVTLGLPNEVYTPIVIH